MMKKPAFKFIIFMYIIIVLSIVLISVFNFLQDRYYISASKLINYDVSTENMELLDTQISMNEQGESVALTLTHDPKIIISDLSSLGIEIVRDVYLNVEYSKDPGEITLYYAKADEEFSNDKKVWGKQQSDGSYTFTLPRTQQIDKIRIDPSNQIDLEMKNIDVKLNIALDIENYFIPTNEELFNFLIYPALFIALLWYIITEFFAKSENMILVKIKRFILSFKAKKLTVNTKNAN